ncbi:MAG TPA: hypothetical protein VHP54_04995 [Caproiciproducens sp.]|nr:hypothetical protein [Caproiciproducens sp.]
MKNFPEEQDTASQPPEPRGEQTPDPTQEKKLEEESGETLLDETIPEEEEENVEWDGSEAELVADEDASEYEEQQTGIKLGYVLTSKEIFYALFKTQYTMRRIALSAAAIVFCVITAATSLQKMRASSEPGMEQLFVACIVLILLIPGLPLFRMLFQSRQLADGKESRMKIYPDHISMGSEENRWEIPLDGTCERTVFHDLVILYIGEKNMVVLPVRCVEPSVLPEVQGMIFAGTQPKR